MAVGFALTLCCCCCCCWGDLLLRPRWQEQIMAWSLTNRSLPSCRKKKTILLFTRKKAFPELAVGSLLFFCPFDLICWPLVWNGKSKERKKNGGLLRIDVEPKYRVERRERESGKARNSGCGVVALARSARNGDPVTGVLVRASGARAD